MYTNDIYICETEICYKGRQDCSHYESLIFKCIEANQGLLYYRTCKPDFLCSWASLNSYLK